MPGPGTWAAGDILTASDLNAIGAWTSYTPVVKQGATSVSATVNSAKYCQINKLVYVSVYMTVTGTGPGNTAINVTSPVAVSSTQRAFGSGTLYDASATDVILLVVTTTANDFYFFTDASTTSSIGATPALTLANGDEIAFFAIYEAA